MTTLAIDVDGVLADLRGLPLRRPRESPGAVGAAEPLVQVAEVGEDAVDVDREPRHTCTAGRDTDRAT